MLRRLIILLAVAFSFACAQQVKVELSGVGEAVPSGVNALAWDGKNLIVAKEGIIVFLDRVETATSGSFFQYEGHFFFDRFPLKLNSKDKTPNITAIAWERGIGGDGYLWVADEANRRLLKMTLKGEILKRLPLRGVYPEDMTFDGQFLWIADSKTSKIIKISTIDGSPVSEYQSPLKVPTALAWDGRYLIVGGLDNPLNIVESSERVSILKLDPESGRVLERVIIPKFLSKPLKELSLPLGMVWIDNRIWISDRNSGKILVLNDWTEPIYDPKNYKLTQTTPQVKRVPIKENGSSFEETNDLVEEARRAAEEAKRAAEEAKKAAEAAKKAFELKLKK